MLKSNVLLLNQDSATVMWCMMHPSKLFIGMIFLLILFSFNENTLCSDFNTRLIEHYCGMERKLQVRNKYSIRLYFSSNKSNTFRHHTITEKGLLTAFDKTILCLQFNLLLSNITITKQLPKSIVLTNHLYTAN